MQAKSKMNDRRVIRTRRSLSKALVELIMEKHYDSITVQDVIDRADVGRSTFYTHFRDKEDLLMQDWEKALDFFVRQFRWENIKEGQFVSIAQLFNHLKDFHPFYRALVKSSKVERLFRKGQRYFAEVIEKKLDSIVIDKTNLSVPLPILSNYLAEEIFSQLKWWLDNNMPHSAEQMDEIFHQLTMPGFRSVIINSIVDDLD